MLFVSHSAVGNNNFTILFAFLLGSHDIGEFSENVLIELTYFHSCIGKVNCVIVETAVDCRIYGYAFDLTHHFIYVIITHNCSFDGYYRAEIDKFTKRFLCFLIIFETFVGNSMHLGNDF